MAIEEPVELRAIIALGVGLFDGADEAIRSVVLQLPDLEPSDLSPRSHLLKRCSQLS